ncbi:hypothetical protein CC1G_07458 [Coprinopsis cinerea okayama7|uniref:BTB domain-containing protein n=1 Tax=Coprinopsis cinerea (strain Okayama-7 / 130 / ATCC MYA-4618 / FGSC 9003) TaxID=240176 RepID=A8NB88_COPC7|nr:hypothetical protein CC1G_07458 [Coprinopsis cinerea okayama7\|eukprot:XP_001832087.2 hypothetical protein CC1G_07458 [Coprinopsis cinerea okayama7\
MFSFSLEGRATSSEGKDESIPIVLEGHKKDDFASLLKVLYPSFDDVTNNFKLVKNEWIGVLRLSTTWEMTRVRNHAIQSLSSLRLSFVEKVTLAREFRVSDWLEDGIVGLVMGDPVPLKDLETLGLDTAAKILSARDYNAIERIKPRLGLGFTFLRETLKCTSCNNVPIPACGCRRTLLNTALLTCIHSLPSPSTVQLGQRVRQIYENVSVPHNSIRCLCGAAITYVYCDPCRSNVLSVRVTPVLEAFKIIDERFGVEIEECRRAGMAERGESADCGINKSTA